MLTKKNGKDMETLTAALPTATDLAAPLTEAQPQPVRWHFSVPGIAIRLFLTCWIVYALHFATNIVREIFPALSLGDHLSFRVDEYAHMHPDLFEKPGYGWHIGNNPGVSMLAAIPYALARPIIDPIVASVNQKRRALGLNEPPDYNSPWPMAREFYAEAWRRGYDIKFGLAALVMQTLAMAPISALTAVVMFFLLRSLFHSDKIALGLSLLYAFGTPVFFRTGYLNHNLMLGEFAFMGLLALWNPWNSRRWSLRTRYLLGGLAGGTAILFDYSGAVLLLGLLLYGVLKQWREATRSEAIRYGIWYIVGTLAPVALLWFYQWNSFGNPFLPGQHWMPPVEWSNLGYQGYGLPQLDLFAMLGFDYRFGFFTSSPLMLLALAAPFVDRGLRRVLPRMELWAMLGFFFAFWVFFSGSNYTRLEFNTGVRYMSAMFPFMFVPAAVVLMRLPRFAIAAIAILSFVESWPLAMYRDVERGLGLLEPVLHVFSGGFQLPWLTTLSRMGNTYGDYFANGVSPLPIFILTAAVLFVIWSPQIWSAGRQAGQVMNIPVEP
jgi:hypothetical protein